MSAIVDGTFQNIYLTDGLRERYCVVPYAVSQVRNDTAFLPRDAMQARRSRRAVSLCRCVRHVRALRQNE